MRAMSAATRALLCRAVGSLPCPPSSNASIYLSLSGGVDSSVSGLLLKERGWQVLPVVMRCWDDDNAENNTSSCHDVELRAATATTKTLDLPQPVVLDLVKEYWTEVFDPYLVGLRAGLTPNPDLLCNRAVKFGAFPQRLREISGGDFVPRFATGHYARLVHGVGGTKLLAGVDEKKDQSYFLASVGGEGLKSAMFPVGGMLKEEVRELAKYAGLAAAGMRSSRGICFVGKRNMGSFLKRYLKEEDGLFVDADSGEIIGDLGKDVFAYTRGERARVGGVDEAYYVVGRGRGVVWVVKGWGNERLFVREVKCGKMDWVGERFEGWVKGKVCSTGERMRCWVEEMGEGVKIKFEEKQRGIVGGQAIVLYRGEECLGAAWPDVPADISGMEGYEGEWSVS